MKISVNNEKTYELSEIKEGIPVFKGMKADVNLVHKFGDSFLITINGKIFRGTLIEKDSESKTMVIRVNNNDYNVSIKDRYDELLDKMGLQNGVRKSSNQMKAPMPGLVLDILVKTGQKVQKNEPVIVLEAMKMENVLKSSHEAIVKSIQVRQHDSVEKDEVLVIFE